MAFRFIPLAIPGPILVEPDVYGDRRGVFLETYKRSAFADGGIQADFIQDNYSVSQRGVLRGLHYQMDPHAQGKLVMVTAGSAFDVAVDIRRGSPSYGRWVSCELSALNRAMLWVPQGFAHGFQALEDGTLLSYKVTAEYSAAHDRGIAWNDPELAIAWPMPEPWMSDKDAALPLLGQAENNFTYGGK